MVNKKNNPFDDIFREFYEKLEEMLKDGKENEPFIFGFKVSNGAGAAPGFRGFEGLDKLGKNVIKERKPLVDVFEMDKGFRVVAEVRGVEKKDIILDVIDNKLEIKARSGNIDYSEVAHLPSAVLLEGVEANYKNGVLDVVLKKCETKK